MPTFFNRLCLFKIHEGACPSPLLWWRVLQSGYCCKLCLFKVHREDCLSPFSGVLKAPRPLCFMSFSVLCLFFSFFSRPGVGLSRNYTCFISGVSVGIPCADHVLTCWSTSPRQVRSQHLAAWEPS
jgi:hypothetical protein